MRYAVIDTNGYIIGISDLSGKVNKPNLIEIEVDFDQTNKKWNGTDWEEYTPEQIEMTPTQLDVIQQAVERSQDEIRREAVDAVMEEMRKRGMVQL